MTLQFDKGDTGYLFAAGFYMDLYLMVSDLSF